VNLPSYDIQIDTVERDDITETLREPASPHRAGLTHDVFSKHTETLKDATEVCVDGDLRMSKRTV
jgi:hypothetical protein